MEARAIAIRSADLRISDDELMMLNNALNEVCNGFDLDEFETRIGASRERASELLAAINRLLEQMPESAVG
jgi:hypothetical protein